MRKQSQKDRLSTEISFIKTQINPHFLFNTLNTLYSLTLAKSDEAPKTVVKLSGMMRYSLNDSDKEYVALGSEIEYISNYISLQQLRLTDKTKLHFEVIGDTTGKKITPFLLIPFVENVFKYGVNPEQASEIRIIIHVKNRLIELETANNKVNKGNDGISEGIHAGISMNNTMNRLESLYRDSYDLQIKNTDEEYILHLKIDLP